MKPKRIGFLLYDGFTSLDVFGPHDAFSYAGWISPHRYEIVFLSQSLDPVSTASGARVLPDHDLKWRGALDTLIIPGGASCRDEKVSREYSAWLRKRAETTRRMVSVCTGAFMLATAELLDNRTASTHWRHAASFAERFPKVNLQANKLYVKDGHFYTSAGITAGIDLALHLVEEDYGKDVAIDVARQLVVHYKRSGDQAQYSIPLETQRKASTKFENLRSWIMDNLTSGLSIERLAEQANMSRRSFYRQFKESEGQTPASFVASLRLDYSRQLLADQDWPVEEVAAACGYHSADVFRRAFEQRYGVTPKSYRENFRAG